MYGLENLQNMAIRLKLKFRKFQEHIVTFREVTMENLGGGLFVTPAYIGLKWNQNLEYLEYSEYLELPQASMMKLFIKNS